MAMGIFTFAIVSITGLFAVALQSDKGAADETTLAQMVTGTQSLLKVTPKGANIPRLYFDLGGRMLTTTNGTPMTNAVSVTTAYFDAKIQRKPAPISGIETLAIEFTWPLAAPAATRQKRYVQLSLLQ